MWGLVSVIVLTAITVLAFTIHYRIAAQNQDDVILDYEAAKKKVVTQSRKEKNQRFNHSGSPASKQLIKEFPRGVENLPTFVHWWVGLSALPVETAEAVVTGTVTNREAYLSEDETSIYTEYEVRMEQVFKDSGGLLNGSDVVPLVRRGGSVRFKSGKIQKYSISGYGVLKEDSRYLMFLRKNNGVDWFILTGYELSDKKVIPIDGQENKDPKGALPFEKYVNADEDTLLQDIQMALQAYQGNGGTE